MNVVTEAAKHNRRRDDFYYNDVISGTIEEIFIDLDLQSDV